MQPTFLLIVDSWRKDHVGAYGNPWIKTPCLDAFARDSVIFDFAYPESLPTLPVRRVLHTGIRTFPFKHNVKEGYRGDPVKANGWGPIPKYHTTLAEYFHDFNVCAFIADTYHQFKPSMNYHRGYHYWEWIRGQEADPWGTSDPLGKCTPQSLGSMMITSQWPGEPKTVPAWPSMAQYQKNMAFRQSEADWLAPRLYTAASNWVLKNFQHGESIFCCVDSFSPHEPFDAPMHYRKQFLKKSEVEKRTPWVEKNIENMKNNWPGIPIEKFTHEHLDSMKWKTRFPATDDQSDREVIWPRYNYSNVYTEEELRYLHASYASLVELTDRWFGRFMDTLKSTNIYDDSAIVLISDHGHQLGEHGHVGKMAQGQFPELNDLILIVKLPGNRLAGTRDQRLVSNAEVFPTLMELKGYDVPESADGFPLFLQDGDFGPWNATKKGRDIVVCGFTHQVMATDKKWYYLTTTERALELLWDCEGKPALHEDNECAENHPDVCDQMWTAVEKVIAGEDVSVEEESSQKWYDMEKL
ncbi:MAG: sulfatase [Candidatus Hodarchaeota archaeon]